MRVGTVVFIFIILVCVFVHLAGYSAAPATNFETGAEVAPPAGCVDYRKRGGTR